LGLIISINAVLSFSCLFIRQFLPILQIIPLNIAMIFLNTQKLSSVVLMFTSFSINSVLLLLWSSFRYIHSYSKNIRLKPLEPVSP